MRSPKDCESGGKTLDTEGKDHAQVEAHMDGVQETTDPVADLIQECDAPIPTKPNGSLVAEVCGGGWGARPGACLALSVQGRSAIDNLYQALSIALPLAIHE